MIKHGDCFVGKTHKLYKIWRALKSRCDNKNHSKYEYYGGKGIRYSLKWSNYVGFKEDMNLRFIKYSRLYGEENISIERIDSNKNYTKNNCTFTHKYNQNGNTKKTKWFIATNLKTGEQIKAKNIRKFAREHNLPHRKITRILSGVTKKSKINWSFKLINNENAKGYSH
jgi:hypothetical protein